MSLSCILTENQLKDMDNNSELKPQDGTKIIQTNLTRMNNTGIITAGFVLQKHSICLHFILIVHFRHSTSYKELHVN